MKRFLLTPLAVVISLTSSGFFPPDAVAGDPVPGIGITIEQSAQEQQPVTQNVDSALEGSPAGTANTPAKNDDLDNPKPLKPVRATDYNSSRSNKNSNH